MNKLYIASLLALGTAMAASAYDTPTMGWSSWNAYGHRINESIIKAQADAMVSTGLKDAGYQYINIDDGAFCGRDSVGKLRIHPTRFPNGLKPLVEYIHSKGLKAGTYSDAGYNTCASFWGGDTDGIGTGLYGHDQQDIDFLFKDNGFDFIKVDFCGGAPGHNVDKLDLDERERYTAISNALAATGIQGLRYNICRWAYPGTWVQDISTSWRVTGDINCSWASVKSIIDETMFLSAYATKGRFNDMDMLEVGRGLTVEEDKTHFGMWCMMSSPLLIGCDMASISPAALKLLTNSDLISINQDPLALQAYVVEKKLGTFMFVKDLGTLHGTRRAVALYNPTDAAKRMTATFSALDLAGNVRVRDCFEQRDMGEYQNALTVAVPAHGTRIYILEADTRLERTVYEAETAWITAYQELENNQAVKSGIYQSRDYCSGGGVAGWLGARSDNDLQWNNVYSGAGGEYIVTVSFISGVDRTMSVEVNGAKVAQPVMNSGGWSTVATIDIPVTLNQGDNTVRFSNPNDWMPDIDAIKITPKAVEGITDAVCSNSDENTRHDVYSTTGTLLYRGLTSAQIQQLPRGIYIAGRRVVLRR